MLRKKTFVCQAEVHSACRSGAYVGKAIELVRSISSARVMFSSYERLHQTDNAHSCNIALHLRI